MRSPFPGMDPFLEDRDGWRDFHTDFIVSVRDALARQVTPNFIVRVKERVDIVEFGIDHNRYIEPDTYIITKPRRLREATAGMITPATLIEPYSTERVVERYIELRDAKTREVVTVIEILSPTNKAPNTEGLRAFQNKRNTVMQSNPNWIEIDLLRAGERYEIVASRSDYMTLLKRAHTDGPYEVWFFNLRDTMPTIAVPLRPPFEDVPLNLQSAFETTFERALYANSIDYAADPPPPELSADDSLWLQTRVEEWMTARATKISS